MAVSSYRARNEMRIPSKGLLARSLEIQNKKLSEQGDVFKFSGRYDNVDCDEPDVTYKAHTSSRSSNDDVFGNSGQFSSTANGIHKLKSLFPPAHGLPSAREQPDQHMQSSNVIESRSSPRRSRNGSVEKPILNSIHEDAEPSFNSTQQLRSGFFRSIKKSYPSLALEGLMVSESPDSGHGDSIASDDGSQKHNLSLNSPCPELRKLSSTSSSRSSVDEDRLFMSSLARRRLQELREADPTKVDVSTGLQWIRLELHEMREQDKALFLQLIKLHSTIKDLRSDLNCVDCDSEWSYDDLNDAASLWWPRYSSTGGTSSVTILPDFSSSDGAQMLRKKRPQFRRGFSLHGSRPTRYGPSLTPLSSEDPTPFISLSSSTSSIRSATAC